MFKRTVVNFVIMLVSTLLLISLSYADDPYAERYEEGRVIYKSGKFNSAINHFRQMVKDDRKHDLSDNCQYWIGECYFAMKIYDQAIIEFDRTLTFPTSNKREDSMYKIALCHEKLGELVLARDMYTRMLSEYPASRHMNYVLKKIKELENIQ